MGRNIHLPEAIYVDGEKWKSTLRQKAMHTIGLDGHVGQRLYKRHGKTYYKPYRNYFCGLDPELDELVEVGYMTLNDITYHFTDKGLAWLGNELGMHIYSDEC